MGRDEDVVIDTKESIGFRTVKILSLLFAKPSKDKLNVFLLLKGCLFRNDHGIFGTIDCNYMLSSIDQVIIEEI